MSEPEANSDLPGPFQEILKGGPIPPVDPEDLECVWQCYREVQGQRRGNVAIGVRVLEAVCRPGANVFAVVSRYSMLSRMEMAGQLLDPWRHGEELDDLVFRVAATFPMDGMKRGVIYSGLPFDTDAFIERLRSEGSGS